jgi:hypothetical protein
MAISGFARWHKRKIPGNVAGDFFRKAKPINSAQNGSAQFRLDTLWLLLPWLRTWLSGGVTLAGKGRRISFRFAPLSLP